MAGAGSSGSFRISPVDQFGRKIDPLVLAAAEELFPRALEHGVKVLGDPAIVTNELEEVAATVSRVLRTKSTPGDPEQIRNLAGYVFRAFVRRVNRLRRRQPVMVSLAEAAQVPEWADPSRQLETKMLLDECLAQCDFVAQDMAWRRMQGFSWEDVGKIHGLSAHAAEARFSQALQRARARLKI